MARRAPRPHSEPWLFTAPTARRQEPTFEDEPAPPQRQVPRAVAASNRPQHGAHLHFDSWGAWVDHCEACAYPGGVAQTYGKGDRDWTLGVTFDGALRMAREGWPEGTSRAQQQVLQLADKLAPQLAREEYFYDRAPGIGFDMGRVLTGDPDCWFEQHTTMVQGPGKPLVLVVNRGAGAFITADVIARRGVAVTAFALLLERAGRACEVRMSYRVQGDGMEIGETVVLKRAGEPVNVDVIAFALGHPATHRRLAFASREGRAESIARALSASPYSEGGNGYGHTIEVPTADRGDVYLGAMTAEGPWESEASAEAWVRDTLIKQGAIAA